MVSKIFIKFILGLIYLYQVLLSPLKTILFGSNTACRFYPSCSEYGRLAFTKHGLLRGFYLTSARLCRCHPFHEGGHDPVPVSFQFFKSSRPSASLRSSKHN